MREAVALRGRNRLGPPRLTLKARKARDVLLNIMAAGIFRTQAVRFDSDCASLLYTSG